MKELIIKITNEVYDSIMSTIINNPNAEDEENHCGYYSINDRYRVYAFFQEALAEGQHRFEDGYFEVWIEEVTESSIDGYDSNCSDTNSKRSLKKAITELLENNQDVLDLKCA